MYSMLSTLKKQLFQNGLILTLAVIMVFSGYYLESPFLSFGRFGIWQFAHAVFAYILIALIFIAVYRVRKFQLLNICIVVFAGAAILGPKIISSAPAGTGLFAHITVAFLLFSAVAVSFYKSLLTRKI